MGPEAGHPLTRAIAPVSLLVLLTGAAILFAAPRIQSDIEARANAALAASGFGWLTARADGRDVTLSGASGTASVTDPAVSLIAALPGVRSVTVEMIDAGTPGSGDAAMPVAYRFGADWNGRTLTLTGYLPSRDARESTVTHARDVLKNVEVDDQTEAAPGAPDGNWPLIAAAGIAAMQKLASARLEISGTAVNFTGVARNAGDYAEATRLLDSLPAPYAATTDIRVNADAPPPPAAPYRFSAAHDGTGTALAGQLPSAETAQFFVDTLKGAMPDAAVDDRSKASGGAPDGVWSDVVALALAAMAPTEGATLTVDGRTLTLEAIARNEAGRQTIFSSFSELPAGYLLTARISTDRTKAEERSFGEADDAAARCQAAFDMALAENPILFAQNGSALPADVTGTIGGLAAAAGLCPDARIEIAAHTDSSGKAGANLKLSDARARAVTAALVAKGVEESRLTPRGYGATRPIASNDDQEGRARNHRIEVIVRR